MAIQDAKENEVKLITCPYCFGKFTHDRVHFKAMTVKTRNDLRAAEDEENAEEIRKIELFLKSADQRYKEFWERFPGSEPKWPYAENPVITPANKGEMCIGDFLLDRENNVEKAKDIFGNETTVRICPHCHNPLPKGYGRKKVRFLSVVGITSSGKTVYLSQLLKNIQSYAAKVGIAAHPCTEQEMEFVDKNKVQKGVPLPMGTPPEVLSVPLFYDIGDYTLVIYDVAGENCVRAERMERFGPFILNADGIIFLLDPSQFSMLKEDDKDAARPVAVLDAMYNAFVQDVQVMEKPIAVTFSKSDEMRNHQLLHPDTRIFQELTTKNHKFDKDTHLNIHAELRQMVSKMSEGEVLHMALQSHYKQWAYFAVTALGCDAEKIEKSENNDLEGYTPKQHPHPCRLEEPLFWIWWKWGIIEAEGKAEQEKKAGGWNIRKFFGK